MLVFSTFTARHELSRRVKTESGPWILGNESRLLSAANTARLQIHTSSFVGHTSVLVGPLEIYVSEHHTGPRALADGAEEAPVECAISCLDARAALCPEPHSAKLREPTVFKSDARALQRAYSRVVTVELYFFVLFHVVPVISEANKSKVPQRQLRASALDPEDAAVLGVGAAVLMVKRSNNDGSVAVRFVVELAARRWLRTVGHVVLDADADNWSRIGGTAMTLSISQTSSSTRIVSPSLAAATASAMESWSSGTRSRLFETGAR